MDARLVRPRQALHRYALRKTDAIQIALRRVIGSRRVVNPYIRHIDVVHAEDVEITGRQLARRAPAARDEKQMNPTAALAHPKDDLTAAHEFPYIDLIYPVADHIG